MKVAVVSRFDQTDPKVLEDIKVAGLNYVDQEPDVVLAHGGDGTLLIAERKYPGIPKLLVKNSKVCNKCTTHSIEDALQAVRKNTYKTQEHMKIEARVNGRTLSGMNDIVVRNTLPTQAIRFELKLGDEQFDEELIGDGIVVSTPFGATGYFYSIAKRSFNRGLGVAFNNLRTDIPHFNYDENKILYMKLTRGEAVLVADNNPELITVKEGETIIIQKSKDGAKLISLH